MVASFYFDKGEFMSAQQDALVLEAAASGRKSAALLAVCDGIGGLQEGEYASSYVTMRIRNWFYGNYLEHIGKRHGRKRIERDCIGMLYECNRYLLRYGKERGVRLGTTMTMALVRWNCPKGIYGRVRYQLFHVGDSRAYALGKRCVRLTGDDRDKNNALQKCIGSFPWQGVQKKRGRLRADEGILLCSDGFWRNLDEKELAESLGESGKKRFCFGRRKLTEEQFTKRLHKLGQAGRARGERDNQAAVAVRIGMA